MYQAQALKQILQAEFRCRTPKFFCRLFAESEKKILTNPRMMLELQLLNRERWRLLAWASHTTAARGQVI